MSSAWNLLTGGVRRSRADRPLQADLILALAPLDIEVLGFFHLAELGRVQLHQIVKRDQARLELTTGWQLLGVHEGFQSEVVAHDATLDHTLDAPHVARIGAVPVALAAEADLVPP